MSELDALTGLGTYRDQPGGVAAQPSGFIEATIATTPALVTDEVYVFLNVERARLAPDQAAQRVGPCRWEPRPVDGGLLFPKRDDRALVVVSDQGHRHIVWWEPLAAPVSGGWTAGDLKLTAKAAADAGWLLCDGASVLRLDFPALFAAIGGAASPWGLPDGTHFRVPDLRGRVPLGAGTAAGAAGATAHLLGTAGGEETHALAPAEAMGQTLPTLYTSGGSNLQGWNPGATGTPHNTLPPFATVNYMIKI